MLANETGKLIRVFLLMICGFLFMFSYELSPITLAESSFYILAVMLLYVVSTLTVIASTRFKVSLILLVNHIPTLGLLLLVGKPYSFYVSLIALIIGFIICDGPGMRNWARKRRVINRYSKEYSKEVKSSLWHTLRTATMKIKNNKDEIYLDGSYKFWIS